MSKMVSRMYLLLTLSCVFLIGNRYVGKVLISAEFTRGLVIGVGLVMGSVALVSLLVLTQKARRGAEVSPQNGK